MRQYLRYWARALVPPMEQICETLPYQEDTLVTIRSISIRMIARATLRWPFNGFEVLVRRAACASEQSEVAHLSVSD